MSFFTKDRNFYKEHAKAGCRDCDGGGIIDHHVDQDWIERSPCYTCFPNDPGAQKAKEWWRKVCGTPSPREMSQLEASRYRR